MPPGPLIRAWRIQVIPDGINRQRESPVRAPILRRCALSRCGEVGRKMSGKEGEKKRYFSNFHRVFHRGPGPMHARPKIICKLS